MAQFVNRKDRYLIMLDSGKSVSLVKSRYKADTAQTVYKTCKHIEASQRNADPLPESVNAWIGSAPDILRKKLQSAGLIAIPDVVTVGELFERFLATDRSVKDATMDTYQWAGRRFLAHFSPEIDITEITRENIEEWRDESLKKTQKLASATVCATLMKVTTVFNFAVRRGWLTKSPLLGVSKGTTRNPSKDRFISLNEIEVIMQACPNQTWRVIIALLRFGGLRPSEVTLLRWSDIHETTFLVTSPKTAHHNGGGSRRCAIFSEIARELDALHIECGRGGDDFVIDQTKYHVIGLSTLSAKLIRKAGLPAIPRFADNFRHSRSIELRNDPNVGPWLSSKMLGHTLKIADGCYSGVRGEDFERVSKKVTLTERKTTRYASPSPKPEPVGVQTADMEP